MKVRLRAAVKADLPEILGINDCVQSHPWTENQIEEELERPETFKLVAVDPLEKIVGYLLAREGPDSAELLMIGVLSIAMRQGVGKRLIRGLLTHLKQRLDVFLEVSSENKGAVSFYEHLGFSTHLIRRGYYRDGSDALCMKLKLANPQ